VLNYSSNELGEAFMITAFFPLFDELLSSFASWDPDKFLFGSTDLFKLVLSMVGILEAVGSVTSSESFDSSVPMSNMFLNYFVTSIFSIPANINDIKSLLMNIVNVFGQRAAFISNLSISLVLELMEKLVVLCKGGEMIADGIFGMCTIFLHGVSCSNVDQFKKTNEIRDVFISVGGIDRLLKLFNQKKFDLKTEYADNIALTICFLYAFVVPPDKLKGVIEYIRHQHPVIYKNYNKEIYSKLDEIIDLKGYLTQDFC
jgi:hypothetical protein